MSFSRAITAFLRRVFFIGSESVTNNFNSASAFFMMPMMVTFAFAHDEFFRRGRGQTRLEAKGTMIINPAARSGDCRAGRQDSMMEFGALGEIRTASVTFCYYCNF
jgi:hypothetical protein